MRQLLPARHNRSTTAAHPPHTPPCRLARYPLGCGPDNLLYFQAWLLCRLSISPIFKRTELVLDISTPFPQIGAPSPSTPTHSPLSKPLVLPAPNFLHPFSLPPTGAPPSTSSTFFSLSAFVHRSQNLVPWCANFELFDPCCTTHLKSAKLLLNLVRSNSRVLTTPSPPAHLNIAS